MAEPTTGDIIKSLGDVGSLVGDYWCMDVLECAQARLALLSRQNEELRKALGEAMEWNWLDVDMPVEIVKQCESALSSAPSPSETEKSEC